jgi:hypothetical protein
LTADNTDFLKCVDRAQDSNDHPKLKHMSSQAERGTSQSGFGFSADIERSSTL